MAAGDERLKVQFEVDLEALRKQLAAAGTTVDGFTKTVEKSGTDASKAIDKTGTSATKLVNTFSVIQGKALSLGKALVGAFSVDLVSRALGLGSAMQLVSKASETAGNALNELLFPGAKKTREEVEALATELERVSKELSRQSTPLVDITRERRFALPTVQYNLDPLKDDLDRYAQALKIVQELQESVNRPGGLSRSEESRQEAAARRRIQALVDEISDARELEKIHARRADDLRREQEIRGRLEETVRRTFLLEGATLERRRDSLKELTRIVQALTGEALTGLLAFTDQERRADEKARYDRIVAEIERRRAALRAVLAEQKELEASEFAEHQAERLQELIDKTNALTAAQREQAEFAPTLAKQQEDAYRRLEAGINRLGEQNVDAVFNSFRMFFADAISGAENFGDAMRNAARYYVNALIDMAAQWIAFKATGAIFGFNGGGGFFGFLNGSGGGGAGGTGNSPLLGGGPGSSSNAAGGGGANVTIQLTVQALDPSTATPAILANMPNIQRALIGALGGGDRKFIEAVRSTR